MHLFIVEEEIETKWQLIRLLTNLSSLFNNFARTFSYIEPIVFGYKRGYEKFPQQMH